VSGPAATAPAPRAGILAFLGALLLLIPFLGVREIATRAEARVPLVAMDIVRTGRVVPPYLLGEPYLNKPPLHHLLVAGSIAALGTGEAWALRIPSAICGAAAVWITWWTAARLRGARAGCAAAAFLFLGFRFFSSARSTELEILLTAATCLSYAGLVAAMSGGGHRGWWIAAGGVAIATLTKGPLIALLFPVTLLGAEAVVRRSWSRLLSSGPLILLAAAVAATAAYFGPLAADLGGIEELRERVAFGNVAHPRPFHYYLWQLPLGLLPAGLLLPWMLARLRRDDPVARTCALAVLVDVVVFSLSESKQSHYLLPAYPLVAIWAAASLDDLWRRVRPAHAALGVVLAAAAGWIADIGARDRSGPTAASIMRDYRGMTAGKPVAMLERHPTLAYHLDRQDLSFPASAAEAAASIEETWGFLIVDLEHGETLRPELGRLHALNSWSADGHRYLLLTASRARPTGVEDGPPRPPR
jgi:4-amino-4-deoxy-L-arabinose transferase-like glycosyltransferase